MNSPSAAPANVDEGSPRACAAVVSLVTIQKLAVRRVEQEKGVLALRDAATLSRSRYDSGLAKYLEILIADQQLFAQELSLARTRGAELRAVVQLYRALGGGWQPEQAPTTP